MRTIEGLVPLDRLPADLASANVAHDRKRPMAGRPGRNRLSRPKTGNAAENADEAG